jgi:hypothetical protein
MPFCEKCGAEVTANSNFCRNCGTPIQAIQPSITHPVPPTNSQQNTQGPTIGRESDLESALGVMFLRKPKSLGRYDSFGGVVTSKRMIFAQVTGDMLKDAIKTARDQAKAEGKGFLEQWAEQLQASFGYIQKYLVMEPSAILSETPGNFAIDNYAIQEIKLKLKDIGQERLKHHEYEIEIKSSTGKYQFRMDDKNEYVTLLRQTYGERVKH